MYNIKDNKKSIREGEEEAYEKSRTSEEKGHGCGCRDFPSVDGTHDAKYFAMASEEKQQELKNASQSVISDMQKRYASMISNLKFLAESLSDLYSVEDETVVSQIKLLSQVSKF